MSELTTSDAMACQGFLERRAVQLILARSRPFTELIREWMIDNCSGTDTTRVEFEEAVRRLIDRRWEL